MKMIYIVVFIVPTFVMTGCDNDPKKNSDKKLDAQAAKIPSASFAHHFEDAGKFLDLVHLGDRYQQQDKNHEAITVYGQALENHAYSRPEQTIALEGMARSYEAIGDLQNAVDHYDYASQTTMNEDRQKSLKAKADTLRQKLSAQPST